MPLLHHLKVLLLLREHRLREDEPLRVCGHVRQCPQRVSQQLLLLLHRKQLLLLLHRKQLLLLLLLMLRHAASVMWLMTVAT